MSRSRHAATTLARSTPGRGGDRDDHLVGRLAIEDLADLVRRAQHLHPNGVHATLAGVVVQEADRPGAQARVQPQLAHHHLPARAGADHQHPPGAAAAGGAIGSLGDHPPREAGAAQQGDGEQEVEHDHRPRKVVGVGLGQGEDRHQQPARHRGGADDRPQVGELEVAPPLLVQAQEAEHDRLAEGHEGDRPGEHRPVALGDAAGIEEAQGEGQRIGGGGKQDVGTELQHPAAVHVIHRPPAHIGAQAAAPGSSPAFVLARRPVTQAGHSGECNADAA